MAKTPSYVRLTPRLSRNVICDVNESGWSISGLDVQPYPSGDKPKDKAQAKYVRRLLNAGVLEPCSLAEYEDVQEQARAIPEVPGSQVFQEGAFQRAVREANEKVRESREEAVAAGANGPSGEVDDEEETEEEETPKKASPAKKASKKKS